MLGEFLQLFVHLGTQQLALTMLFLVTLVFVTVCFASTDSTYSPVQRKNGEYIDYGQTKSGAPVARLG